MNERNETEISTLTNLGMITGAVGGLAAGGHLMAYILGDIETGNKLQELLL